MKFITAISLSLFFLAGLCKAQESGLPKSISVAISYKILIKGLSSYKSSNLDEGIRISDIELTKNKKRTLLEGFTNKIGKEKKVENFVFEKPPAPFYLQYLSIEELFSYSKNNKILKQINSNPDLFYYNEIPFVQIESLSNFNAENLSNISFFETWDIDNEKFSFTKNVKLLGIGNNQNEKINFQSKPYSAPIIQTTQDSIHKYYDKNLFMEEVSYDVIFAMNNISHHDNQYNTNSYFNIPKEKVEIILYSLMKLLSEKKLMLKNEKDGKDMLYSEWLSSMEMVDSVCLVDDYGNTLYNQYGELEFGTYSIEQDFERLEGFRFYETWYFDKENFSLLKKVNAISLIFYQPDYDEGIKNYILRGYITFP